MENPYQSLAYKHALRLDAESVITRPDHSNNDRPMDHWKCVLIVPTVVGHRTRHCRTYSFYYSKGYARQGARPTVAEALESFRSDLSLDISSFEAFCRELGMNPDSISVLKVYNAVKKQNAKLLRVLGEQVILELLAIED